MASNHKTVIRIVQKNAVLEKRQYPGGQHSWVGYRHQEPVSTGYETDFIHVIGLLFPDFDQHKDRNEMFMKVQIATRMVTKTKPFLMELPLGVEPLA